MKIDKNNIEKLGRLAKLEFDEKSADRIAKDLANILEYVEQLNQVDTENSKDVFSVNNLNNVWRDDYPEATGESIKQNILDNATESEDDYIKVRRIL